MFETVTSGVIDFFPKQLTNKRVLVNIVTGLAFFICGLPLTMNVNVFVFISSLLHLVSIFVSCIIGVQSKISVLEENDIKK